MVEASVQERAKALRDAAHFLSYTVLRTDSRIDSQEVPSVDLAIRPLPMESGSDQIVFWALLSVVNDSGARFRVALAVLFMIDEPLSGALVEQAVLETFALGWPAKLAYDNAQRFIRIMAAVHEQDSGLREGVPTPELVGV